MAFPSKYNSFCIKCRKSIRKGEMITKDNNLGKWVHQDCPNSFVSSNKIDKMDLGQMISQAEQNSVRDDGESVSVAPKNFIPSSYQQAAGDFVKNPVEFCKERNIPFKKNAVMEAVAGSGKTTTLVWVLNFTNPSDKVVYLAFNKPIVQDLKNKQNLGLVPQHVGIYTLHSFGWSVIREATGLTRDDIDQDKVSRIMDNFWPIRRVVKKTQYEDKDWRNLAEIFNIRPDIEEFTIDPLTRGKNKELRSKMRSVVSLAKATLIDYSDQNAILEMCENYNIEIDKDSYEIVYRLQGVLDTCKSDLRTVDFDDMIWLCLVNERIKSYIKKQDFALVDEGQDLNNAQIEFVLLIVGENGRVLVVGDRKQSLYGFRGADTEAIPRMIKMLDAQVLPLSISYRCPKSIVKAAKELVPQIEAWENAKEGEILEMKFPEFMNSVKPGDMVVCRTNAPLVEPAFTLIKKGQKAIIRGQDIGEALINFVEKFNASDLMQLESLMREWTDKEVGRLIEKGKELAAEMALDKHEVIMGVAQQSRTVMDLVEKLRRMFSDKVEGVIFSSVHRAKGLEANNVYVLHKELMPHPKANMESWEGEQEWNCKYVAITRSKERLIWVLEE